MENQVLINLVYEHLRPHEVHAVQRGSVTVIVSALPLVGSDLYAYLNAYSFKGRFPGLNILLLFEPITVLPGQYDEEIWRNFDYIYTHYDKIIAINPEKFRKVLLVRSDFILDQAITENVEERKKKYTLDNRLNAICMINGNKASRVPGDGYSKRREAALWFSLYSDIPFDVYGNPPFALPNYKRVLEQNEKFPTFAKYKYGLCFENIIHPEYSIGYVDKIYDCLETRTVPIYWGAPDIGKYVPEGCFIDVQKFKNYRELDDYLHEIDDERYQDYIQNIDQWVSHGGLRLCSMHVIYNHLSELLASTRGIMASEFFNGSANWTPGISPLLRDRQWTTTPGIPHWSFQSLAMTQSPLIDYKRGKLGGFSENGIHLEKAMQLTSVKKYAEALQEFEAVVSGGVFNSDILYEYAHLLIKMSRYEEAFLQLQRVIMLEQRHSLALNDLAALYILKKDYKFAVDYLYAAIEADKHNVSAVHNLHIVLTELDSTEYLNHFMESLLAWYPDDIALGEIIKVRMSKTVNNGLSPPNFHDKNTVEGDVLSRISINGLWREGEPLRLHLGCGENHFEGYINIDFPPSEHSVQTMIAADLFADITLLVFPAQSVDEIRLHHVFEHFSRSKALALLIQWHSWLKIGGKLHIETPDVIGSAHTLVADMPYRTKQGVLRHAFGSHEASRAYHLDGWYKEKFEHILSKFGFSVQCQNVQWKGDPWLSNVHALAVKEKHLESDTLLRIADEILLDSMVADVPGERLMHQVWCRMVRDELGEMQSGTDVMSSSADGSKSTEKVQGFISGTKNHTSVAAVIFSKDRAMQLDAALRSLWRCCTDATSMTIKVIYFASSALHNDQYEKLKQAYLSAQFIPEKNFKDDLLAALSQHDYVMFLVDDNMFVKDFKLADAVSSLEQCSNALGFSFRLGENTRYCYMLGRQQNLPAFDHLDKIILRYNWTTAELDFGYPLELSSSLYRVKDIMPLLDRIDFKNPNTLELQLEMNKSAYASAKPALLCFDQSVAFCNPVNMVQTMWANKSGKNIDYTPEKLSALFAQGYRIDVDRFSGFVPNSCHQEVAFEFTKTEPAAEVSEGAVSQRASFVTIGIANWNGIQHIQGCLESIRRNTPEPHEIIVVDNGSTDGSREYLREQMDVILVENTENMGAPGARNQFLSIARGNYIVFLDNDTYVTHEWLKKLIAHMEADPQIGIIGACTNYATGLQGIPGVVYKTIDELEEYAKKRAQEHRGELLPSPRLISFCVFVRKAAVEKIGSMETGFSKFCFEDDDYALRISIAGFKSVVANDVFIHHSGGPQGRGDKQYNKWLFDAWDGFKRKWGLPQELPFGSGYDAEKIASSPFDPKKHYIPLYDPASIEPLIWRSSSGLEKLPIMQTGSIKEIPSLINPEFIEGMISIIIPVQSTHLSECVASIKQYTKEPHEIIFLDHGAAPKLKKQYTKAMKKNSNYKVIKIDRNDTFNHSLNEGINQSTGESIVLLFDDVMLCEGWLADMLEFLNRGKKIGVVGAMAEDASVLQRVEGLDFKSLEERTAFRERNRHRRILTRNLDGFCMLFRRDLLIQIGVFDENLGQDKYMFDDFCVRAVLEGYDNITAGNVFVHNLGGINRLLSRDKTLFDEKWIGLDASTPLAKKVLIANAMALARSQYHKGVIDEAVITLIKQIGFYPNEKRLFYQLAGILLAENRFQDALGALKGMSDVEDDAEYYALLGYGHEGLGTYKEAEEYADKSLAMDGKSAPALNLKGILAYRKADLGKAEEFFMRAMEADPGYGDPYTNMGRLRWKAEQREEAVGLFERGFILCPDKGDIVTAYYTAITSLELYGRAENIFREARSAYPENKHILFLLIDILLKQDKFQGAMQEVEKAMINFGMDEGILSAALEIRRKIGPKSIAAKDGNAKAVPTLSVCMIVKNEQRYLASCLNSLSPVADEIIVVDTGSVDKTKEIAEAYGAQLHYFEWINDFAVARNVSLSKAQGDWILVMDADEVLSFQDHAKLKQLMRRKDKTAYSLITRNYINASAGDGWTCNDNTYISEQAGRGWFPSGKVRLFPNNEKIRFENPIHELVEYSILRIGMHWQESGIPVHHYGELDADKGKVKDLQYYELGVQKMKESGGDSKSVFELAVQAGELGKTEESIELWHKFLGFKQREATAYFNLANHYLKLGKYEESYDCSRKSYTFEPGNQSAVLSYAMSEFLAGDINKTISVLEGFLKGSVSQISHVALLAASRLLTGDKEGGLKYLQRLVKQKYNCVHFLKDLAQSLITGGNIARAKSLLTIAIEIKFYDQETSALLAKCEEGG